MLRLSLHLGYYNLNGDVILLFIYLSLVLFLVCCNNADVMKMMRIIAQASLIVKFQALTLSSAILRDYSITCCCTEITTNTFWVHSSSWIRTYYSLIYSFIHAEFQKLGSKTEGKNNSVKSNKGLKPLKCGTSINHYSIKICSWTVLKKNSYP